MTTQYNNRRRSMSFSSGAASPYLSQSDTTSSTSSSLWNSNKPKSYFLSRFNKSSSSSSITAATQPQQQPMMAPSSSISTNFLSTTLPPIGQQQKVKRKPVVGPSSSPTTPTFHPNSNRKKYEAVLGIKAEELLNEDAAAFSTKKSNNSSSKSGFGNLFKKKSKPAIIDNKRNQAAATDSLYYYKSTPQQVNINNKTELLPPLLHHQQQQQLPVAPPQPQPPVNLPNYKPQYHQYEVKEQPSLAYKQQQKQQQAVTVTSRLSLASTRKSTGSVSIYSTFGPESIYGENESAETVNTTASTSVFEEVINEEVPVVAEKEIDIKEENTVVDLAHIVANNVQTRTQARIVQISDDEEEEEDEDDEDDESELGDSAFVDATGWSQEDMERERIESRLSKRLSGGHFGSAGGIAMVLSMNFNSDEATKKQKRTSRPPPEDVVKSMMNWKRQSGGQALGMFLSEQQQRAQEQEKPPVAPEKDAATPTVVAQQPVIILSSSPPPRPLPPNPEILLSTTEEVDEEEEGNEEPEQQEVQNTELLSVDNIEPNDPKECASRLWHEDETFVQRERIAEWLGQSKPLNTSTLNEYMDYFDFATMRLDSAFRKVCSKLYFRAEAQQIDRILEAFAKRYWQCNPKTIFGSADTVYAVVYSLLLLNTDLHVAQGSYTRMTRHAFVKNTMSTIRDQLKASESKPRSPNYMMAWEAHIEAYLKDMYISVKNYQILQPLQNQPSGSDENLLSSMSTSTSSSSSKRMSMMGGRRMIDIKRSLNTMIHKSSSTRESMLFSDEPSPRKSTSSSTTTGTTPRRINTRRDSFSSTHSGNSSLASSLQQKTQHGALLSPNQSHMMNFMDTHAADLFANRPPYLKEGVVMRKHLLESANQKAKHREWRECLLVVGQGELKMYGLQSDESNNYSNASAARRNMIRASSASFANLADSLTKNYSTAGVTSSPSIANNGSLSFVGVSQNGNNRWAAYSQLLGSIELNHTLSNALPPPGYNRTRPYVFAIQEPNGGVYLFQAASQEQIREYVDTCNYNAAFQSKQPLQGGVSNIEYGWGSCLDDVILDLDAVESGKKITGKYFHDPDAVNISSWIPPAPTMVSSILDEQTQYDNLQKYLESLNQEINDHREIKKKILVKFPHKCQNHVRALSNWEAKSKYMLHEIIKYQNYCDVLEKSIIRREEEEKKDAAEQQQQQS